METEYYLEMMDEEDPFEDLYDCLYDHLKMIETVGYDEGYFLTYRDYQKYLEDEFDRAYEERYFE